MIELPAALAPWAAELAVLPTDLALALAPWVGRLALAIGALSEDRTMRGGEPDGYRGLSRRGSYERLITGEWAVAEEFPDEFLRRAAAGEHLFLELSRQGHQGARRSIAIVSAGPDQLGAPRLVHLAALVVLARRATAAGAGFAWGILEDDAHRLHDGFVADDLRRLVEARTARTAGEAEVAAWREALRGAQPTAKADLADWWLLGGRGTAAWARHAGACGLAIDDVVEPGARAIAATVDRRGAAIALRLELPAPEACVRLLRDPVGTSVGPRVATTIGPARRARFGADPRRLLVELADGTVQSWPLPNSPAEPIGQPRRGGAPASERLVAIGTRKRGVMVASVDPANPVELRIRIGREDQPMRAALGPAVVELLRGQLAAGAPLRVGTCGIVKLWPDEEPQVAVDGPAGILHVIPKVTFDGGHATPLVAVPLGLAAEAADIETAVIGAAIHEELAVWAAVHPGGEVQLMRASTAGTATVAKIARSGGGGRRGEPDVVFGFSHPQPASWGPVAVRVRDRTWTIVTEKGFTTSMIADAPVVGVAELDGQLALLTQPHDRRLTFVGNVLRKELPPASAPIVDATTCTRNGHIVWVTATGEVTVYSMRYGTVLMRVSAGGKS